MGGPGRDDPPFTVAAYFGWHQILHRVAAALLLVPAVPLILALVALVRWTSKGPGIYSQTRVGRNARSFRMLKIRTMRIDAEAVSGPVWTASLGDPRITRLGRVLRRLHLDEFPQLWNVVKGEMALVGPRPERPEFVDDLVCQIPGYLDRLCVLPGITGLAQLNLPSDSDLDSVRRKLIVDVDYIRNGTLGLDLRILLCTLLRLIGIRASRVKRMLGLHRQVILSDHRHALASHPAGRARNFATANSPVEIGASAHEGRDDDAFASGICSMESDGRQDD